MPYLKNIKNVSVGGKQTEDGKSSFLMVTLAESWDVKETFDLSDMGAAVNEQQQGRTYTKVGEEQGYSKEELLNSETPAYEKGKTVSKASKDELDALWTLAKERASEVDGESMYLEFGETMYDMLALEASSHPVTYIRALGTSAGVLYPPDQLHPNKRFVISQDILEMLLRSCVSSGEIISGMEIRQRLWDRFGIIIGGSQFEMQMLQSSGMIMQIDEDALEENFSLFAATLESMDFAEVMADGILQIRMGGAEK